LAICAFSIFVISSALIEAIPRSYSETIRARMRSSCVRTEPS